MKFAFSLSLLLLTFSVSAQEILSPEIQIKTALLAAPEEVRSATSVYGYNNRGEAIQLKKGTNNLVCITDDPGQEGISISCYSIKLDPFMARGRELKAEGKNMMEIREIRKKEVESGILEMPDVPSMLYVLNGSEENFDRSTGELRDSFLRYVIYTPFATTESTGLPDKPYLPGMPWLMDPGTHRAHIMITPEKKN